jgi:ABC-type transport system involved in multi-copper enzyme maturation permease subunit
MLWVTWRQHWATFTSIPAVLGAVSVFLVVAGLKVHHNYAALMATSANSPGWQQLNSEFNSEDWTMGNTLMIGMQLVPVLLGAFAGAPLLARELENGTFRYAWTQGLVRERWVIAKLALLGLFVTVAAGAFGELFAWFFAPFIPQEDLTVLDATVFGTRGIAFAAWTLAAFMIAVFGGMLLRRIIPAMAVTLGVYLALQLLTWLVLRPEYQATGFWPAQFIEGGWLLAMSILLAAGTVWLVRHRAALSEETSMTVRTLSAQSDADTSLKPAPWRRMLWVTWRQHRPAFIGVTAVYAVVTLYLVLMGLKIHRDFAALTACHPATSDACGALANSFTDIDWRISNATLIGMNLFPAFLGAFAGAPLLARDLENGTFRYMWTQGAGRVRSTIARLVLAGLFISVLAGVAGQVFAWFFQPALQNAGMTVLAATVFVSRGLAHPAWTLAAFMIGAFCGMLLRRTVPAMAATLGTYLAVALLAYLVLRPMYPVTRFWPMQFIEAGWLLALSAALIAATVWLARHRAA